MKYNFCLSQFEIKDLKLCLMKLSDFINITNSERIHYQVISQHFDFPNCICHINCNDFCKRGTLSAGGSKPQQVRVQGDSAC